MIDRTIKRTLWAAIGAAAVGAAGLASAAETPIFITKPYPFTNAAQEAGGSTDLAGDFSLMGAKILGERGEDSGGAYLFENGNYVHRQLLELKYGATITYRNYYHSFSGARVVPTSESQCTFTQNMVKGGYLGEKVALSHQWAALASYEMGRGLVPPHEVANCDNQPGAVPAIFLAKRNATGSPRPFTPLGYGFNTPFRQRVQSMDLSDTDLVFMAGGIVYVFTYDAGADEWNFNTSLLANEGFGSHFGQTVAIDGNHIVVGDRDEQTIHLFRKQGSTWSKVGDYQRSNNPGFGRAVDISGNDIIVAGDASADFFAVEPNGLRFVIGQIDPVNPRPFSYVAISGDHATAAEIGNTTTLAHFARNLAEGGFYLSARVPLPLTNFVADNINMDGIRIVSGDNSWSPNSTMQNVGAMMWRDIEYPFTQNTTVDDAEGDRIWHNRGAFNWERHQGSTQSSGTGPSGGSYGSQSYYYVETSQGGAYYSGDEAILETESIVGVDTLEFDYHMQGDNVGQLHIEVREPGGSWETLDVIDGTQSYNRSNDWRTFVIPMGYRTGMFRFRYVAAGGWKGDVALDNITIIKN